MDLVIPAVALALIPVDIALVALAKMYLDAKYAALVSVFFGIILACLIPDAGGWRGIVLDGIIIGLSASGLYSGTKAAVQ